MKLSKLMLGMAVAATTLAACNKEDITPVVEQGNKSVTLNIANLMQTKGTGTEVAEGTAVKLNSVQVFFSDGTTLYAPKSVDAKDTVATYFEGAQAKVNSHQFHFLPKAVSKVIVLGNMPYQHATTYTALLDAVKNLTVGAEQDPEDLRLFGIDETLVAAGNHAVADQGAIQHPNPFVKAEVNLVPTVARFEVVGFNYAENPNKAEATETTPAVPARTYTEMVVNSLSMRNWYTTATATFAGVVTPATLDSFAGVALNKDNIYGTYFTKVTAGWYYDATAYTLNAANNYVQTVATVTVKDDKPVSDKKCYDYHVFPGAVPQFLIELTGKENGVNSPLFLMTSALKVNNAALTAIEAGKVYRMTMTFDDRNLQAPEKCVEVAISVDDWNVVVVTPEF